MKLVSLYSGLLISNTIGDNKSYNSYIMPGEMIVLTDDDADSMISSGLASLVGEAVDAPGISIVHPYMSVSIDVIPRVVNEYHNGVKIISTPEFSEIVKAFGVNVSTFYPIEVPYVDIYTESISIPNMELLDENNSLWADVSITGVSNVVEHVKGMNGSKAMVWITKSPKVHPDIVLSLSNALSELYDIVFLCGGSDIELDLYKGLCYNENVVDFVGRIGSWSSVVRFADMCDFIISPNHWIPQLMTRLGKDCQIIGPSSISGIVGVGGSCVEDKMYCQQCSSEFCPAISRLDIGIDGDEISINLED